MSPIFLFALLILLAVAAPLDLAAEIPLNSGFPANPLNSQNCYSLVPRRQHGYALYLRAYIGTIGNNFSMSLNTASNRTFVAKVGFDKGTTVTHYYNPAESKTSKDLNQTFVYKDGKVLGVGGLYEDKLNVYPTGIETNAVFGALTKLYGVERLYFDGQLGLAWTPYSTDNETPIPIIHEMLKGKSKKIYQIYSHPKDSKIVIGNSGIRQCEQKPTVWFRLLDGPQVPMLMVSSFEIGKYHYAANHRALFDASEGSIHLPVDQFRTVLKTYNAKFDIYIGAYLTECSKNNHEWIFTIRGSEFKITDKYAIVDIKLHSGRCALMIEESEYLQGEQIYRFGMPFFYRYCATFDVGRDQLGFSESVELRA